MDIPVAAAKQIATKYDYDQVIIIARKAGRNEHVTTYGKDRIHCKVAAQIGNFLKYKVMGWKKQDTPTQGSLTKLADRKGDIDITYCHMAQNRKGIVLFNLSCMGWAQKTFNEPTYVEAEAKAREYLGNLPDKEIK